MKKFFISLTFLILLTISILILYLSFYGYQTDRSMLRLTIYDAKNGDPLWTGLRSTQYVDKELKLDQEQISKYVQSFLSELVG